MKLFNDFGVTAWFGTLILIGTFALLALGLVKGMVSFSVVLPLLATWVGAIVSAYFTVKAVKTTRGE